MKKQWLLFLLLLALVLTACGRDSSSGAEPGGTPMEKNPNYTDITAPLVEEPKEAEHIHRPSETDHTVEHEPVLYCGNTVTTVSRLEDENWEASFWGDDSISLTDLLAHLDYSGDVCKCLPEYNVDTEFGTGYGVNLTERYVRHDGGQVSLTEEQVELIQNILDRQQSEN